MSHRLRPGPDAASVGGVNDRPEQTAEAAPTPAVPHAPDRSANADLDRIERDLAGVEAALERLDAGTYWTDEVTGEQIPDAVLISDPVARRAV
jgi:RNA polymerase-binding transcription factor DksA